MRKSFIGCLFIGLIVAVCLLLTYPGENSFRGIWEKVCSLAAKIAPENDTSKGWPTASISDPNPSGADGQWYPSDVEPAPPVPLEEALSFSMSIPRILGRWPHVSTGIVEENLFGYRVPLVTGTAENDITGSLTYFFGSAGVLRRIHFEGDTGDARRLLTWLANEFHLARDQSDEQGIFLYRTTSKNSVVGELRIYPRTMIQASLPHRRFEVSLLLDRPTVSEAAL